MGYQQSLSVLDDLQGEVNKEVRQTAFLIDQGVVLATPRDKGYAKGSFVVSVGTEIFKDTDLEDRTGSKQIEYAKSQIDAAEFSPIKYPTIYITSQLPYIARLADGYSAQAPSGYIDNVILRVAKR